MLRRCCVMPLRRNGIVREGGLRRRGQGWRVSGRPANRTASIGLALLSICFCAAAQSGSPPPPKNGNQNGSQDLNREFQAAVSEYQAGRFPEAAAELEHLLPLVPGHFEVEELLGLVYAGESQDAKAREHLEAAVKLKPDSSAARTNLAATLLRSGETDAAKTQLQKALALAPADFEANRNLGELYLRSGKLTDALPYLERAQRTHPGSYANGYDLALAYFLTGRLDRAGSLAQSLLPANNTGELHDLLGEIDEKDGKYLAAANEFQTASHLDPSEDNLFDWGSELLLHRTYEPAVEVFQQASLRYPNSPRLLIGLGMALYARGMYDEAVKALLAAAGLSPADPRVYLFLSKAYDSSPKQAEEVIRAFRRYAELQPGNGLAQYYYAMSIWKGQQDNAPGASLDEVQTLLQKSIALDPSLPDAHLQLGNFYSDRHQYADAIPEYQRAIALEPNLPDAHYRLGVAYARTGEKDRSLAEFAVYQKQRAQHLAEVDKERAEVRQFIYSSKSSPTAASQADKP